jgi:YVTN family beta-propeller protein
MIKKVKSYYIILSVLLLFSVSANAIIDRSVATIHVGLNPSGVAITPDGRFAYVANNNTNQIAGYDSVSVIDLQTNKVIKVIYNSIFEQLGDVAINNKGTKVYITNSNSTNIIVIDVATNTVETIIGGITSGPLNIVLTPDSTRAYVSNPTDNTVSAIDLVSNTVIGSQIPVGASPGGLSVTPDGKFVYVANFVSPDPDAGSISVISTATNTVVETIKAGFVGPSNIIIDSAGKYAYITNRGSVTSDAPGTVSVLNLKTNKVIYNLKVGVQPEGLAFSPNGRFLYVTNLNSPDVANGLAFGIGIVNIIDTVNFKVLEQELLVGFYSTNIAISSDGTRAYVTNFYSDSVSVLDINDQMWLYKKLIK